jgi:hypothetical protein
MEISRVAVGPKKSALTIDKNRYAKTKNQDNGPE